MLAQANFDRINFSALSLDLTRNNTFAGIKYCKFQRRSNFQKSNSAT